MGLYGDAQSDVQPSGRTVLTGVDSHVLPLLRNVAAPAKDIGDGREGCLAALGRAPRRLVINGRFLGQPLSGVQRYAREVVKAMDRLAAESHQAAAFWDIELHHPPGEVLPDVYQCIRIRRTGKRSGHLWEQLDLPATAKGALLLNLANTAPVLHPAVVATIHDVGVFAHGSAYSASFRLSYRMMFRLLGWKAHQLLTVSSFSAREIGRYCGIRPEVIALAPNAADHLGNFTDDPSILDRLGLEPLRYVLAVGSRNRLKNVSAVVEAVRRLGADRPRLVIVGQKSAAIFQGAPIADEDFVIPTGAISDSALRSLYHNALCLAFPSFYEGFGIPPLEAMREGCPVIAAATSAIPEVCADAILYCDPSSPDDIAGRIARLSTDGDLRERLIGAGRERSTHYSWRATALSIFEQLNKSEPL
jgi:glycosyltransferase involved in cell wall biosynthesis